MLGTTKGRTPASLMTALSLSLSLTLFSYYRLGWSGIGGIHFCMRSACLLFSLISAIAVAILAQSDRHQIWEGSFCGQGTI